MNSRRLLFTLMAATAVATSGCASMSDGAVAGTLIGGLAGAGVGRAVGHHNGSEARGGWAGAGIGAVVGGLAGEILDRDSRATVARADLNLSGRVPYGAPEAPPAPPPVHRDDPTDWDLPPIPEPGSRRVVRRTTTTTTTTTTVRRATPPGFVVIER